MAEPHSSSSPLEYDEDYFEWEERDESISYGNHCIAGSIAGVTEHVSLLPFDRIKTHIQVHQGRYGAWETAKYLYKTEGILKFWKGASVLASGCAPAHAAYFSMYEFFKKKLLPKLHDQKDEIYPYAYALTGILATFTHDLIITPFDTLKQREQIAPPHLSSTRNMLRYIAKTEGLLSLYRGFPITLLMNGPHAAVLICVNESLKVLYRPKEGHSFLSYLLCAATAGSIAATCTIPLDNIKTRLQTQNFYVESRKEPEKSKPLKVAKQSVVNGVNLLNTTSRAFISSNGAKSIVEEGLQTVEKKIKYKDILSTIKLILKEEGPKGFVKGVVPRVLVQAPSSAISWTAYEMLKKMLNNKKAF